MKQSTFSAQVANNLLTVLQGYSKTIRLLLVMLLTLTVTTNAWAEEATLSFANKAQRTSFSTTKQVWEQNGVTFTNDKASSTNAVADYANPVRLYANSSVTVECSLGNMTEIVFNANTTGYATTLGTSIGNTATVSSKAVTVTLDGTSNTFTVAKLSGQVRLDNITVTYTAGGGGSTPTPTLNVDPATLTFENTTTNTSTPKTFTLTGSNLTANASLQLSGINPGMFSLSSNSVTQSAGNINQIITVTYTPTATGSHNATLTISSTGAESKTVTLSGTGVAPAAKYTVTFDAGSGTCDDESLTETSGGAGVTLPIANPPATCATDGWNFAGWWTEAVTETTTSPGELLTAGSNYKPASDCTLYAVYSHTEAGGGGSGFYLSVTKDATTYYIGEKGSGSYLSAVTDVNSAATFNIESNQYLYYGNKTYVSSTSNNTSLTIATTTPTVTWAITEEGETITFKSNGDGGRYLAFNYNNGSPRFSSYGNTYTYELTKHTTSTTTYNSNPSCEVCENILTINKGAETNGNTFTLSQSGNVETCDGDVEVVVTPTPAEHYSVSAVTATAPTSGGAPTVTNNGNGTWTVTYAQDSKGESTISVTFVEDAKASITLSELNVPTTDNTTYYVGETYTLPSTSLQSCAGKQLVGWSTVAFAETDTRPTENYYGISTQITLAETQTFYAVFAQSNGGGGGNGDYARVTEALDDWSGDYLIAYDDHTFANGSTGGTSGMGAEGNKQDLSSHINNNTIPANIGDLYNVTLVTVDDGYVLQTKDNKYNYQSSNANGLALTDNIETAKQYPLTVTFNNENDIAIAHSHGAIFHYNKNQNGYFRFYKDGGQELVYLYKKSGTAATYTGYTTSCASITSIRIEGQTTTFNQFDPFEFGGTVYAIDDEDNETDVTALATFTGYDMSQAGEQFVTVTCLGHQITYAITVNEVETWHITWNVSGATNTGIGPRYVAKGKTIGECSRTGDIQIPAVPTGCTGKTFIGWTESNTVPEDGVGITYINKDTKPDSDKTYYAVFATVHNVCTRQAIENIADGSKVVIVAGASVSGTSGKAISSRATMDTHNLAGDEVTIDGNQITTPHVTCLWIINKVSEGVYRFEQNGKYLNGIIDDTFSNLKYLETKDSWNVKAMSGKSQTYTMESKNAEGEYIEWYNEKFTIHDEVNTNGEFDMQFYLPADLGSGSHGENYTTGCHECTITYYGFSGGYSTQCGGDDLNSFTLPVNSAHTIPNCGTITDPSGLNREFLDIWNTKPHGGKEFKPGDTFILTQDTTFYAQWKLETDGNITLPTDLEDLAGTDIYVYGGTTLTLQTGTTTINSLTLKGGLQADGSYKMPTVWVPEGATLVRNSNKIYLDLKVNAKTYYPFAVPFAAKNDENVEYLDPVLAAASYYGTHFVIKTYDGARRAEVGEDKAKNWVKVLRETSLQPGVGYIITALTYPDKDTATIRIPMTVPNTWFQNGEQAEVGTTVRNTIAVTAHAGAAATEHQRHAGWNFVANPYLTSFAGGNVANDGDLAYINGELIIEGSYVYGGEDVPYVTVPAYDFAYYSQHKLSEVKLSPEWSFFVQVGTGGTMNFTTAGRQQAPASIAARNAEERPVKMDVDLILSDNHNSDQTGIIISDRYSDAYEIGRDLEKLFGSAYNLSVYTLMEDNTPLAFQALAIRSSMQVIPVGYRAPEQGEYTFRLNEATSSIDLLNEQYEQLVLVDYQTGELTNLLYTDYTFYSERTQSNSRFAIYAVPRQNAPTDLPNAIGSDEEVRKVIYNDHLYILRDGNVYNGMGQKM